MLSNTMNANLLHFLATPRIHAYYLAHAQISPSGGVRRKKASSVDDVDSLLPVTTRHRNSSDEANSRVLFPLDSVPRTDSRRAFSFSLSGSLAQGEIRRGSCTIVGPLLSRDARSVCPPRSGDVHDITIEILSSVALDTEYFLRRTQKNHSDWKIKSLSILIISLCVINDFGILHFL